MHRKRIFTLLFISLFMAAGAVLFVDLRRTTAVTPTASALLAEPPASNQMQANCRYGVSNLTGAPSNQWIPMLGAGWWLDFSWRPRGQAVPDAALHVPQIRMRQEKMGGVYLPTYAITPALNFEEDGLGTAVANNRHHIWIAGNEPDVPSPVQDNMYPEVYARAYHEIYHYIKGVDPTAQVAIAGLSMMTPGRMQYLDIVWDTYQDLYGEDMPVDVWNMHLYILSEFDPNKDPIIDGDVYGDGKIALGTDVALAKRAPLGSVPVDIECPKDEVYCRAEHDDMDIFIEQVLNMRQWMKDHGQQDKPLLLSEFSQLYPFVDYDDPVNPTECFLMDEFGQCFTPNRVTAFMQNSMNYLATATDPDLGYPQDGNRLVQQWMWYNLVTPPEWSGGSSNLLVQNYQDFENGAPEALTQMGAAYRAIVAAQPTSINLTAGSAPNVVGYVTQPGDTGTVSIQVGFFNNGTTGVGDPFEVTFYADAALTEVIGTAVVDQDSHGTINGCAWGRNTDFTAVTWSDLPVGVHQFWAKIDSSNVITAETDESDNVASGKVTIYPEANFTPIIAR